jgi:CheY-like chemotaxis protein
MQRAAMPRLLLLEDDPDSLEIICTLLRLAGFEVVGASATRPATSALERGAFDLVLADLLVDTKDLEHSWRMIDQLVERASPTPVGLLTGWPIQPHRIAQHRLAFQLAKPFSSQQLLAQLATTLAIPPLTEIQQGVLRAYFEAIERSDWDTLGALCTEDVTYDLPGTDPRFTRTIRGRAAFCEFSATTFARLRQPRFVINAMRGVPRGAIVEYVGSWDEGGITHKLDGNVLFVFDADRIAHIGVRIDPARLQTLSS